MSTELKFRIEDRGNHALGFGYLVLECEHGHKGECKFSVWPHAAARAMWQWDGNKEAPTISPSIDCRGGCGRHFTMIKGEAK